MVLRFDPQHCRRREVFEEDPSFNLNLDYIVIVKASSTQQQDGYKSNLRCITVASVPYCSRTPLPTWPLGW